MDVFRSTRSSVLAVALAAWLVPVLCPSGHARAAWTTPPAADPSADVDRTACDDATRAAEHETGVPDELLTAISRVEAGRSDPATGVVRGWPWTIDVEGTGHVYPTEAAAIAAVQSFQAAGARSIDVGCMQVNLRQHPEAFASLADAFDPMTNAAWAARFLTGLFHQTGSWPHAAAAYHSMTPELGANYQEQVLRMWAEGDGGATGPSDRRAIASPRADARQVAAAGAIPINTSAFGGRPWGADHGPTNMTRYGPSPGGGTTGRGLAAYRATPIAYASRPLFRSRW